MRTPSRMQSLLLVTVLSLMALGAFTVQARAASASADSLCLPLVQTVTTRTGLDASSLEVPYTLITPAALESTAREWTVRGNETCFLEVPLPAGVDTCRYEVRVDPSRKAQFRGTDVGLHDPPAPSCEVLLDPRSYFIEIYGEVEVESGEAVRTIVIRDPHGNKTDRIEFMHALTVKDVPPTRQEAPPPLGALPEMGDRITLTGMAALVVGALTAASALHARRGAR